MFGEIYKGKKVLVTGDTGFKGAWLSLWLNKLGAQVYGVSNEVPTQPALFEIANIDHYVKHYFEDIRNLDKISEIIHEIQPDFLFHLAAQPIVKLSYDEPVDTYTTNVIGTVNILEALRTADFECTAVMITSDKCYDNVEWEWGYKETDALGGKDPYSASKGAAEIAIKSYYHSYFSSENSKIKISSVRAGNVIGGGDWAANRLIPDIFRSWSTGEGVTIRSPYSTRPWQHVLEPLSGYLVCGQKLYSDDSLNGVSFNFGPNSDQNKTVLELLTNVADYWKGNVDGDLFTVEGNAGFHEAGLLKLNCDRALHFLHWKPTLQFKETVEFTGEWYNAFYNESGIDMFEYTNQQIQKYVDFAAQREVEWTE